MNKHFENSIRGSVLPLRSVRVLSRAAHEANQSAKGMSGAAQDAMYLIKDIILEAFVLTGEAKVNGLSPRNVVGLDIVRFKSQLHMPLRCFSQVAQAEVLRQLR
jgi:hypothetical protein